MDNLKKTLLAITFTLVCSNLAFSQWTKQKGKGYYKLSAWYLEANRHFTDTGETDPNTTRSQFNVNFYGEYGVSDKWNITGYIPFFSRAVENDEVSATTGQLLSKGEAFNSFGDMQLGVKYRLLKTNNYALSVSLKFDLPTGDNAGGSDGSFQTGDGEFNQLLQTSIGTSFNVAMLPSYAKLYLGFNNRTKGFSDEIRTGLEMGINIVKNKCWLIGKVDALESLRNGTLSAQNSQGSIFANNVEYVNIGAEIAYYFTKKMGISFNYTSIVSGRIIYASPSYSGGLFLDIK